MSIDDLMVRLHELGARPEVVAGQLRVHAPRGVMTPELHREVQAKARELVDVLRQIEPGVEPAIPRVPRAPLLPVSYAQQQLWFLDKLDGDRATYNIRASFRLEGRLDLRAFGAAIDEVVRR